MVIVAGTYMGMLFSQDIEKEFQELWDIRKSFLVIHADISYGCISMGEVMGHVKSQAIPLHSAWFGELERRLKTGRDSTFCVIWEETITECLKETHMSKVVINELKALGKNMGNVDKNQQLAVINLYIKKLEIKMETLENEKGKKQKLYRTLGILGSIFIVVLLI